MLPPEEDRYDPYARRSPSWQRHLASWQAKAHEAWSGLVHDPAALGMEPLVALQQRRRYINRGVLALVVGVALAIGLLATRPIAPPSLSPDAVGEMSSPAPAARAVRGSVVEHRVVPPALEVQGGGAESVPAADTR